MPLKSNRINWGDKEISQPSFTSISVLSLPNLDVIISFVDMINLEIAKWLNIQLF